jgi:hypothetical protein
MAAMGIGGVEIASDLAAARQARISVAAALRGAVALAADLLFPPVCISCRKRAGAHGLLCGDCWPKIDFITPPLCAKLGLPLPYDTGEPSLSAAAMAEPPVYDRGRAAARYSSTMRELIQRFKYGDRHEGVALFGRWMAAAGAERSRRHRARPPLPVPALVAALQPVGHSGAGGVQIDESSDSTAFCLPASSARRARSG